ncbi:cytochrome P450 [Micromonospora sp. R77]|uniref:cytochrome P450 n=1 Tax=Micromonospora sp. R77 TaxID=2925836 RepID=UPI001F618475|nr:cytochrome P450 [Micromonospora sp. R77]MCI4066893.1 cytochrome P450 [Micromonospora sp. R77]
MTQSSAAVGAPRDEQTYPMRRGGCPFDPPPAARRLGDGGPQRVTIWDGSRPWLFTRYDDVRVVLSDPGFSADKARPGFPLSSQVAAAEVNVGPTLLVMDGAEHAATRRMLMPEFTVRRSESRRPQIARAVDGYLDDLLAAGRPADFVATVALPTALRVICELLGVPHRDAEFFRTRTATMGLVGLPLAEATAARRELFDYLLALVHERDRQPRDDFLSRLTVRHVRTGSMTPEVLAAMALLVLTAGHDTAANMMSLGVLALIRHPEQFAHLRRDPRPSTAAAVTDELLRYLTVVQRGIRRIAVADVDVNGHRVRAGEGVIAAIDVANRDRAHFPQGDDLAVTAPARHHLAFGYGNHQCIGQALARVELESVYAGVARRIPGLRLAVPLAYVRFKSDMAVYGVHELPVTW